MKLLPVVKPYLGEFLGTFLLVFIGCGSIVVHNQFIYLGSFGIAVAFGVAVFTSIALFGSWSGAHINPAVSVVLASDKKISWPTCLGYLLMQNAGALCAAGLLILINNVQVVGHTEPQGSVWESFVLESLMTGGILVLVAWSPQWSKIKTSILIGSLVFVEAWLGGPISGASMNPARSFGPAIVSNQWTHHWVYWIAPILGGLTFYFLFKYLKNEKHTRTLHRQ